MISTSLVLAVSLMVAVGPRFRDGLGKWTASMMLQALMFGLYAARGTWPDFVTIVVANALFFTCITLQAAAIREFHHRSMSNWWHVLPMLLAGMQFALVMDNFTARIILNSALYGSGLLVLAIMVQRLDPEERGYLGNNARRLRSASNPRSGHAADRERRGRKSNLTPFFPSLVIRLWEPMLCASPPAER